MDEKMVTIKAVIAGFLTACGAALGWQGIMAVVWIAVMLLDVISGMAAACKCGEWSSAVARQGVWHKVGMILVVIVSVLADLLLWEVCTNVPLGFDWPVLVFPLVLAWYIITELGSILENAVKMGATVPSWLTKLLKISLKAINDVADNTVPGEEEETE